MCPHAVTYVSSHCYLRTGGTSWGELVISRFPSMMENNNPKKVSAHVTPVSAVCFLPAGIAAPRASFFSAGGRELTIFCWRLKKLKAEVDASVLSLLGSQRVEDIRLLSAPLPCRPVC